MTLTEIENRITETLRNVMRMYLKNCQSPERFKWAFMEFHDNNYALPIFIEIVENEFPQHLKLLNKLRMFL